MAEITLTVPDIGADAAEVVEVLVAVGDTIEEEQSLIVLESDKASMEVPATSAGVVKSIAVTVGDEIGEGAAIVVIEAAREAATEPASPPDGDDAATADSAEPSQAAAVETSTVSEQPATAAASTSEITLSVPDIGSDGAEVVEILVAVGDTIDVEQSLIVLESDKASMEMPATAAGKVLAINVAVGDTVNEGDPVLVVETSAAGAQAAEQEATEKQSSSQQAPATESAPEPAVATSSTPSAITSATRSAQPSTPSAEHTQKPAVQSTSATTQADVYAGPAVRKLAREFGIDLTRVTGSGPKGRLLKEDLHRFVSAALTPTSGGSSALQGAGIEAIPEVDFSQFGAIDPQPRSRLDKLTAANMRRAWLNVPHVTQFDDADITDLEEFRQSLKVEAERRGTKLSPLPFILKACAVALNDNPKLKASLADGGDTLVYKHYCHIGMAVDTPAGLMVPVLRDVDQKSVWELGAEILELAGLARDRKLRPEQMQGGVFSISSLGAIGGRGFTPIVNAPEVAILGVSRAGTQPVWDGQAFVPRTLLPLSLSYDHRVVNGGDAGRFLTQLVGLLGDIRRCLL